MENLSAKNLRIGNIVRSKINGISKVVQIGSSINPEYVVGRSLKGNYWENSFLPVEITEQWLLNFGFEIVFIEGFKHLKIEIGDHCMLFMERNDLPKYSFWIDNLNLGFVKYVNELQNLYFALTGKDLELRTKN